MLLTFGEQVKNPLFNFQQPHYSASNRQVTASKSRHRGLEETLDFVHSISISMIDHFDTDSISVTYFWYRLFDD